MAAVLKNWREAATLILVTGRNKGKHRYTSQSTTAPIKTRGDNLEVLMLKRSSNSSFMPSAYVFPGGVADDADFSSEWLDIFRAIGTEKTSALFDFVTRGGPACPLFARSRDPKFSTIPAEIALRICAIRETFEESGVLLVRPISDVKVLGETFGTRDPMWGSVCEDSSVTERWRREVDKDSSKFVKMCKDLDVVPDVWSLLEWSNWLTPATDKTRRFDTAFFICCILHEVPVAEDKGETVHSIWSPPLQLIHEYQNKRAILWPPQQYSLSILANFRNVEELRHALFNRLPWRPQRWMPVRAVCDDGIIMLLPGDELYPDDPDFEDDSSDFVTLSGTMEDLRNTTIHHNRVQYFVSEDGSGKCYIFSNADFGDPRFTPVGVDDLELLMKTWSSNAKL